MSAVKIETYGVQATTTQEFVDQYREQLADQLRQQLLSGLESEGYVAVADSFTMDLQEIRYLFPEQDWGEGTLMATAKMRCYRKPTDTPSS